MLHYMMNQMISPSSFFLLLCTDWYSLQYIHAFRFLKKKNCLCVLFNVHNLQYNLFAAFSEKRTIKIWWKKSNDLSAKTYGLKRCMNEPTGTKPPGSSGTGTTSQLHGEKLFAQLTRPPSRSQLWFLLRLDLPGALTSHVQEEENY